MQPSRSKLAVLAELTLLALNCDDARTGGASADITDGNATNATEFFDYGMLGLTPPAGQWGLWPDGSACIDCTNTDPTKHKLLMSFAETVLCNPQDDGPTCLSLCGQSCTLKLYATIIGGSGDPDLYVRFASSSVNACASTLSGVTEDCAVAVPLNEKTAYVTVHGYAAGSFMLRTAYAGK